MRIAVNATWINTGVTPEEIRRVFYRQPCLVCILAKRNKDSKLICSSFTIPSGATAYNQPITIIDHIPPRYQVEPTLGPRHNVPEDPRNRAR